MPGFSDEERDEIESALVDSAQQLFTLYGFQKTTVEDITEPVGIAESTFYRFFDSKTEMYTRVLLREQDEVIDAIESEVEGITDPERKLERLFRTWATEFEKRDLLVRSHREPQNTLRSMNHVDVDEVKSDIIVRVSPIVEDIQANSDGLINDLRPEVIFQLLSVLELIVAQKEAYDEYGWGYSSFKDTVITILTEGLMGERPEK
ncbi:TetR/AcrR family transcriptional regulator [Haladaptatus sp. DYF46]|uniref:TetR/AcrR family transcriptional regulator n=1 Tax=Haladaptatus sp. DYF46 TaxID=2886041 RepID=UPI001E53E242|nr:TetR/AcrR family transcriptional regulator [Haladaptatus sp. DYF46]